ncbi:MAG: gliding motility lipoprotein GldH [Bacteroidetes bacterium]|nr:gliding motility lipoprotein GldH [Bacteroidota bacterium]
MASCDPNLVYEKNVPVPGPPWIASDPVTIDFEIHDTLTPMNLFINLRHNTSYEKSNLFLFVDTWYPNDHHTRDTLEFVLAHPDGEWIGDGFGKIKALQVAIARGVKFPLSGHYKMQFEQAMRNEALNGIEDIGLRIEKMQNN